MSGKSINFDDKKINKSNFYKNKKLFSINDLDVNKIIVCKKESNFPQMIGYVKNSDSNKTISISLVMISY